MKTINKETSISNDSLERIKTGDWKYSPHYKEHSEGHIFSKSEGNLIGNIVGASAIPQSKLNHYGNFICEAVNNYNALKEANKELIEALEKVQYQLGTHSEGNAYDTDDEDAYNLATSILQKAKQL